MHVNLIGLTVQSNNRFVCLHPVNEDMDCRAQETGKMYYNHPRYLVLSHAETMLAIDCCRGTAEFYPYLDDGIHLLKFSPRGLVEISLDGVRFERLYFTMPGTFLAGLLQDALDNAPTAGNQEYTRTVSPHTLLELASDYAPRVVWEYERLYDYDKHELTDQTTKNLIDTDLADSRQTRLADCLDSLRRIAINHSDGIPSVIRISPDHRPAENEPTSYYWTIHATNRATGQGYRVMNGGIIAHENHKDPKPQTWQYSTHT